MQSDSIEEQDEPSSFTDAGVMELAGATASQWKLLILLGIAGLLASVSVNILLYRNNHALISQRDQQAAQVAQIQGFKNQVAAFLQDIAAFSRQDPDVQQVLVKYGIRIAAPPAAPSAPRK